MRLAQTYSELIDASGSWMRRAFGLSGLMLALLLTLGGSVALDASSQQSGGLPTGGMPTTDPPDRPEQIKELKYALQRLPLAALLAAALAVRPRRRGTPSRSPAVIQTQIILAVLGALVMLVVGSSLARAFGIVGAAGLVRYRAKIDDPKDAGVMLATLAIGLASGVGMWMLAIFGTIFILFVLWVVESFEPIAKRRFSLEIKVKDPAAFKPKIEKFLEREKTEFEMRAQKDDELLYEVCLPLDQTTDQLSKTIIAMGPSGAIEVEITEVKKK